MNISPEKQFDILVSFASLVSQTKKTRFGQELFNSLLIIKPDLAEEIRGGEFDPFYLEKSTEIARCLKYISINWDRGRV